jgi:hypothetical protein
MSFYPISRHFNLGCHSFNKEAFRSNAFSKNPLFFRSFSTKPDATMFVDTQGKVNEYFFKNNPWKLSDLNKHQKIYRFCVICGDEKFPDKAWARNPLRLSGFESPVFCEKIQCGDSGADLPAFVTRDFYIVETMRDYLNVHRLIAGEIEECFHEVPEVVSTIRHDKVFSHESDIPKEYSYTFKDLENTPVELRISKIDLLYFEYAKAKSPQIFGRLMSQTSDPYLKALADYREKSIKILEKMRNSNS